MKSDDEWESTADADDVSALAFLRSKSLKETLKGLDDAFKSAIPVVGIVGSAGAGTSRVLREWASSKSSKVSLAYIQTPKPDADDLLGQILQGFGLEVEDKSRSMRVSALRTHLLELAESGDTAVLAVDDANNLSQEALELAKMLATVQHNKQTLLRLVLGGQQELEERLKETSRGEDADKQLAVFSLAPFTPLESASLFEAALEQALDQPPEVDPAALEFVYTAANGNPGSLVSLARQLADRIKDDVPSRIALSDVDALQLANASNNKPSVGDAGKLPGSIRNSKDQQALLRFALARKAPPKDEAPAEPIAPVSKAPKAPKASKSLPDVAPPEDMPEDLSAALAKLADAETDDGREALQPQRQEGRPGRMKIDPDQMPGAGKKPKNSKGDAKSLKLAKDSDEFAFAQGKDAKAAPAVSKRRSKPKPRQTPEQAEKAAAMIAAANLAKEETSPSIETSKLREALRSSEDKATSEGRKYGLLPAIGLGMAAAIAGFVAYPMFTGSLFSDSEGSGQTAAINLPRLPQDPPSIPGLGKGSSKADASSSNAAEIVTAAGAGPNAEMIETALDLAIAPALSGIDASARPSPVRISARGEGPNVRPIRINPLQREDVTSVANSLAVQIGDAELENALRLKHEAESQISALLSELGSLRNEVKTLREDKGKSEQQLAVAGENLELMKADFATAQAALEAEEAKRIAALNETQAVVAELAERKTELEKQQDVMAQLREEELQTRERFEEASSNLANVEDDLNTQRSSLAALAANLIAEQSKQDSLASILAKNNEEMASLDALKSVRNAELQALEASIETARQEQTALVAESGVIADNQKVAEQRLAVLEQALVTAEATLERAESDREAFVASLDAKTQAASATLADLVAQNTELESRASALNEAIKTAQSTQKQAFAELEETEERANTARAALAASLKKREDTEAERSNTQAKLESVLAALVEAETTLAGVETQKTELEQQIASATETSSQSLNKLQAENSELEAKVSELAADLARKSETQAVLETALSELQSQKESLTNSVSLVQSELAALEGDRESKLAQLADVEKRLKDSEETIALADQDRSSLLASLDADTKAANARLESLNAEEEQISLGLAKLREETALAETRKNEIQNELLQAQSANAVISTDLSDAQSALGEVQQEIARAQGELEEAKEDRALLAENASQENEAAQARLAKLDAREKTLLRQVAEFEERATSAQELRRTAELELQDLVASKASMEARVSKLAVQTTELDQRRIAAESDLAALSAETEQAQSLMNDLDVARAEFTELANAKTALTEQVAELDQALASGIAKQAKADANLAQLLADSSAATKSLADAQNELATLNADRDAATLDLASLQSQLERVLSDKEGAETASAVRLAALNAETQSLMQARDAMEDEISQLTAQAAKSNEQANASSSLLAGLSDELETSRGATYAAKQDLANAQKELAATKSELAALKDDAAQVEIELADLRSLQEAETLELARLEATVETATQTAAITRELREIENIQLASRNFGAEQALKDSPAGKPNATELNGLPRTPVALAALDASSNLPQIGESEPRSLRQRPENTVLAALNKAPGLTKLSGSERNALKTALVNGTCIPDALRQTTGTINRLTLRALLRGMDRCSF